MSSAHEPQGIGPYTWSDFVKLDEEDRRELIDGWLVDVELRTFERLVLKDGLYAIAESLEGDAVLRPASYEGLEIPLAELWQAAEDGMRIQAIEEARFPKEPSQS